MSIGDFTVYDKSMYTQNSSPVSIERSLWVLPKAWQDRIMESVVQFSMRYKRWNRKHLFALHWSVLYFKGGNVFSYLFFTRISLTEYIKRLRTRWSRRLYSERREPINFVCFIKTRLVLGQFTIVWTFVLRLIGNVINWLGYLNTIALPSHSVTFFSLWLNLWQHSMQENLLSNFLGVDSWGFLMSKTSLTPSCYIAFSTTFE